MFREFYQSMRDIKREVKSYMTFNLIVLLFSAILFIPFFSYAINRLFLSRDTGVILNTELFKVVLSPRGILAFMGFSLLGVLVLFIVLGTQLIYSEMIIRGQEVTMVESFLTTLRALPKLLRFELLYFVLLLFLMIPIIENETNPLVRYFMETPPSLLENLNMIPWGEIVYRVILVAAFYMVLRTIFVFHGILLERKSIRKSVKLSLSLTKGRSVLLIIKLFLLNGFFFGILFGFYYLFSQIPSTFNLPVNYLIRQYVITLAGLGLILFFMILIPVNLLFLTRRYHDLNQGLGYKSSDGLHLVRWKKLREIENNIIQRKFVKKRTFALFLVVTIGITYAIGFMVNQEFLYTGRNILIAAHRGDEQAAPENTLAAIISAMDNGADIIEIDLQMTKDGVVVIHHDSSLIRTAGISDSINTLTYEEVKDLDVGSYFDSSFQKERIPTLEEIFFLATEDGEERVKLLLDVKTNDDEDDLAREMINLIKAYNMEDRVLIQSFNYNFLKKIKQKNEALKIGQIMYAAFGRLENLNVDFYTVRKNMLTKQLISRARKADMGIFVWVIEKEQELKEVMTYDIDGVITSNLKMTYDILRQEMDVEEMVEENSR